MVWEDERPEDGWETVTANVRSKKKGETKRKAGTSPSYSGRPEKQRGSRSDSNENNLKTRGANDEKQHDWIENDSLSSLEVVVDGLSSEEAASCLPKLLNEFILSKCENSETCRLSDFDGTARDALQKIFFLQALQAIEHFAGSVSPRIQNRPAYLMGILRGQEHHWEKSRAAANMERGASELLALPPQVLVAIAEACLRGNCMPSDFTPEVCLSLHRLGMVLAVKAIHAFNSNKRISAGNRGGVMNRPRFFQRLIQNIAEQNIASEQDPGSPRSPSMSLSSPSTASIASSSSPASHFSSHSRKSLAKAGARKNTKAPKSLSPPGLHQQPIKSEDEIGTTLPHSEHLQVSQDIEPQQQQPELQGEGSFFLPQQQQQQQQQQPPRHQEMKKEVLPPLWTTSLDGEGRDMGGFAGAPVQASWQDNSGWAGSFSELINTVNRPEQPLREITQQETQQQHMLPNVQTSNFNSAPSPRNALEDSERENQSLKAENAQLASNEVSLREELARLRVAYDNLIVENTRMKATHENIIMGLKQMLDIAKTEMP